MIVELPADTWVDLYVAADIPVGEPLILNTFAGEVNVAESATEPAADSIDIYALAHPRTPSTLAAAGSPGVWGRSYNNSKAARVTVQLNTF